MNMTIRVVGSGAGSSQHFPIQTLNEASAKYRAFLDAQGLGSREAGRCFIYQSGKAVAHVSFNGRVWAGRAYKPNAVPIYDPMATPAKDLEPGDVIDRMGVRCKVVAVELTDHPLGQRVARVTHEGPGGERGEVSFSPVHPVSVFV